MPFSCVYLDIETCKIQLVWVVRKKKPLVLVFIRPESLRIDVENDVNESVGYSLVTVENLTAA